MNGASFFGIALPSPVVDPHTHRLRQNFGYVQGLIGIGPLPEREPGWCGGTGGAWHSVGTVSTAQHVGGLTN